MLTLRASFSRAWELTGENPPHPRCGEENEEEVEGSDGEGEAGAAASVAAHHGTPHHLLPALPVAALKLLTQQMKEQTTFEAIYKKKKESGFPTFILESMMPITFAREKGDWEGRMELVDLHTTHKQTPRNELDLNDLHIAVFICHLKSLLNSMLVWVFFLKVKNLTGR